MHDEIAYQHTMARYAEADHLIASIKSIYRGTNVPEKSWVLRAKRDGLITEEEYELLRWSRSY